VGDFEEQIQIPAIRSSMRIWQRRDAMTAFAYVDSGNNLRFEIAPGHHTAGLEQEIMDWGITCMRERNARTGKEQTLDATCRADDEERLDILRKFGFEQESIRTLQYTHSLDKPIEIFPFPAGFSMRCVTGEDEVKALVSLHRAAFGTDNMTIEERLAIMRAPNYTPDLDLVAISPNGELCAFCICGIEEGEKQTGTTDPIGTHQHYQRLGLGKAILSAGLHSIQVRGAVIAKLGTSSENIPMQKLAERVGFVCVSENLWFSKKISR
jgi:ribosomal protein S18 acetylase RimI-like enzyme